ncbi:MAG: RidA family protein, partial [Chitinophagaceae bacterium]|nr:RidA family protein [Chitinophagaceae bacterium]
MQTQRRSVLKKLFASLAALTGIGAAAKANTNTTSAPEKEVFNVETDQEVPLFSGSVKYGGLVFIA